MIFPKVAHQVMIFRVIFNVITLDAVSIVGTSVGIVIYKILFKRLPVRPPMLGLIHYWEYRRGFIVSRPPQHLLHLFEMILV